MYRQISDYALIGDMRTAALVSSQGSIDWLCWPRFDSPALFLSILDDEKGGCYDLQLDGGRAIGRAYETDTNILQTRFLTAHGEGTLVDFMAVREAATELHVEAGEPSRLVRILRCTSGSLEGRFRINPTFDFARDIVAPVSSASGARFNCSDGRLDITTAQDVTLRESAVEVAFSIQSGQSATIVLSFRSGGDDADADFDPPEHLLEATRRYWQSWIARCTYEGEYAGPVRRSALCLKLMTYAPTGGTVAAPTTGLPEAVPGNRNFDYRFTWLRDASFTTLAFLNLGFVEEAEDFLRFLSKADGTRGRDLRLMYGLDGEVAEEVTLDHLKGWRQTGPVRIGNRATLQRQHDIYGEFLIALHAYLDAVGFEPPREIADVLPELITNLADQAMQRRFEPDNGIWELRSGKRHLLHTKALLWVALDRAAKTAKRIGGIRPNEIAAWEHARDDLRAEYLDRGWNEERGAFVQSYGSDVLDSSVLRVILFGAIDPQDPRLARTLTAIETDLADGDLIRRYRADDGFEGEEGAFLVCSFWRVGCLALMGRTGAAKDIFDRLLARANDVGLFAEEIDPRTGESRGNFPQGFTHMAVINHAIRLRQCIERFGLRD